MKVGLEAEYWVIDAAGALTDGRDLARAHEHATPEFVDSLIEVQTPPVEHLSDLAAAFREVLQAVLDAGARAEKRLVPLGTPLSPQTGTITTERGRLLERIYEGGIQPAINCAGTHVHFDRGNVTRQLNLLTALDPALALVSSSPYYRGRPLADSSRAHAYRLLTGERFSLHRDLWEYTESVAEWDRRIETRYEELRAIAAEHDITGTAFTDRFQPENAVLTPVRLRTASPTVEWRAPDTALPSQVLRLVADVKPIVERTEHASVEIDTPDASEERLSIPPFERLKQLSRLAIQDGLASATVREYLLAMGLDPSRYRPITARIAPTRTDRTSGAESPPRASPTRRTNQASPTERTDRIDEATARRVREEYATALREDVAQL